MAIGCTTEETSSTSEQALSCKPETPFCDAEMPPSPPWKKGEQAPAVNPDSGHGVMVNLDNGEYVFILSDLKDRKVVWARTLKKADIGSFIDLAGINVAIDIGRKPPRPPRPGGGNWLAYYSLEFASRALPVGDQASDAADKY